MKPFPALVFALRNYGSCVFICQPDEILVTLSVSTFSNGFILLHSYH